MTVRSKSHRASLLIGFAYFGLRCAIYTIRSIRGNKELGCTLIIKDALYGDFDDYLTLQKPIRALGGSEISVVARPQPNPILQASRPW